jgi:hypothetical protein
LVRKGNQVDGSQTAPIGAATPDLNQIELGPIGKRGAAAALMRLEEIEELKSGLSLVWNGRSNVTTLYNQTLSGVLPQK